ncbi:MAG: HAD-IIIA family hydrolase [Candidatus Dormibacteraeota bacterium]|nr:HAD-IIIA family hydrolase [Candidatus Dormibacteraeota bacterium]
MDVLLDRDGVIVAERPGYVLSPDDVVLLPGAADAIRRLCDSGCRVFVVTNQSPLGRGLIDEAMLHRIHARVDELIGAAGGHVDGFFVCPHAPDDGCFCRNPQPGLLLAARDLANVQLDHATFIGDQVSDLAAAAAAGCRAVLVLSGLTRVHPRSLPGNTSIASDLVTAVDLILGAAVAA